MDWIVKARIGGDWALIFGLHFLQPSLSSTWLTTLLEVHHQNCCEQGQQFEALPKFHWWYWDIQCSRRNIFFNEQGNRSVILLFPRFKDFNAVQLARDCGTSLCIIFLWRSRIFKEQLTGNASGIRLLNLFSPRFNTPRVLLVIADTHVGILPVKLLDERSRTSMLPALQMDSGIRPWRLLFEREKKMVARR